MDLFDALGFRWNRDGVDVTAPTHPVERAAFRFKHMLAEFVWDAAVLEGNPFTYPQVKTLLDGVTVGGHRLSDHEQVIRLAVSLTELYDRVKKRTFAVDKATFCWLHACVAEDEAMEWGKFRGEGSVHDYWPHVALGEQGTHWPPATEPGGGNLDRLFADGLAALEADVANPLERGMAFFLFGALQQFFFDGNKRTSRLMMNGILMSHGIDAISVPARRAEEFNEKMIRFYVGKDATEMMHFLVDCHPEADLIRRLSQPATPGGPAAR
jgi:Fic family protein